MSQAAHVEPAYGGLLQELCLALVGITGDVFVDTQVVDKTDALRHPSNCTFRVNPEATWLSVSDRGQIEDVLTSGYHFHEIDRIVQRHQALWGPQAAKGCWQGLCLGLEGTSRSTALCKCQLGEFEAQTECSWHMLVQPLPRCNTIGLNGRALCRVVRCLSSCRFADGATCSVRVHPNSCGSPALPVRILKCPTRRTLGPIRGDESEGRH